MSIVAKEGGSIGGRLKGIWRGGRASRQSGVAALARKVREERETRGAAESARHRANSVAILPKPHSYGALSVRDVFRLYQDERAFRERPRGAAPDRK